MALVHQCTVPTPAERRALLFLAALAALGVTARGISAFKGSHDDSRGDRAGLDRQIAAVDSAVAVSRPRSRAPRKASGVGASAPRQAEPSGARPGGSGRTEPPPIALYEARRRAVEASNAQARSRVAAAGQRAASPGDAAGPGNAAQPSSATARGLTVDLDIAGADAIAGLPWIGDALAARIVADRTARGPFGSLAGLQRVRGIGPGLATRIAPYVTFSRSGLAHPDNPSGRPRRPRDIRP